MGDVQYFDSDFSFEEHAAECAAQWEQCGRGGGGSAAASAEAETDDACDGDGMAEEDLLPNSQSKVWDEFHSNHSAGNFYKPRRYLTKCFPCILRYLSDDRAELQTERILLEIGCGSGSSCIPILKHCMETICEGGTRRVLLLACDSSPVAVETTRRYIEEKVLTDNEQSGGNETNLTFGAFVGDPGLTAEESDVSFLQKVKLAHDEHLIPHRPNNEVDHKFEDGIAGIVMMVFVLSAVAPSRVPRFLEQIYQTTQPGGKVCLRDYALYDMPMLRFAPSAACKSDATGDPVFVRGEGTIARFFSVESVRELFEAAGFRVAELKYATVYNHNRKTGEEMKRVFVHGVLEKPPS
ncbi:hypothetical protein ACHAXT_008840 [Thalassiosira profunda]